MEIKSSLPAQPTTVKVNVYKPGEVTIRLDEHCYDASSVSVSLYIDDVEQLILVLWQKLRETKGMLRKLGVR